MIFAPVDTDFTENKMELIFNCYIQKHALFTEKWHRIFCNICQLIVHLVEVLNLI